MAIFSRAALNIFPFSVNAWQQENAIYFPNAHCNNCLSQIYPIFFNFFTDLKPLLKHNILCWLVFDLKFNLFDILFNTS